MFDNSTLRFSYEKKNIVFSCVLHEESVNAEAVFLYKHILVCCKLCVFDKCQERSCTE